VGRGGLEEKDQAVLHHPEQNYKIFYWLLTVPVVKDFISQGKDRLLLQPNYDVQETVLQVEIITHVCMNRELEKEKWKTPQTSF
jgi:hypothetical protein